MLSVCGLWTSTTDPCNVFRLWHYQNVWKNVFIIFLVVMWWCFFSAPEQLGSSKTQFWSRWWYLDSAFFHWVQTHKQGILFYVVQKGISSVFQVLPVTHMCLFSKYPLPSFGKQIRMCGELGLGGGFWHVHIWSVRKQNKDDLKSEWSETCNCSLSSFLASVAFFFLNSKRL